MSWEKHEYPQVCLHEAALSISRRRPFTMSSLP